MSLPVRASVDAARRVIEHPVPEPPEVGAYLCQREPLVRHVSVSSVTRALRVARILGVVSAPTTRHGSTSRASTGGRGLRQREGRRGAHRLGAAAEGYAAVLALDPQRPGVQGQLDRALGGQKVAELQAELREHVVAEDWPAAVSVAEELQRLSPDDSDPEGLATTARTRLGEEANPQSKRPAHPEQQKQRPPRATAMLRYVLGGAALVPVASGVVWAWPGGDAGSRDVSAAGPRADPPTHPRRRPRTSPHQRPSGPRLSTN